MHVKIKWITITVLIFLLSLAPTLVALADGVQGG